ncbi:hypothetical protein AB0911_38740 [Streptomyces nigra]|uniref:hypothetical protein n=1 Tax=Streptomyces nigra TaxID=1827580 RepID=UPI003455818F
MNDRRPQGTRPYPAAEVEVPLAPRAQLAAERLPAPAPAAGRRVLGDGPAG